jgi:hypothetical protein
VLATVDLAAQDDVLAVPAQVLEGVPRSVCRVEMSVKCRGRPVHEISTACSICPWQRAVAHDVALRVAVDAVHALLVVDVGAARSRDRSGRRRG